MLVQNKPRFLTITWLNDNINGSAAEASTKYII